MKLKLTKKLSLNKTTIAQINGKEMLAVNGGTNTNITECNTLNNFDSCVCDNSRISYCLTMCESCGIWYSECCPC